jgi:hypothetical protein
VRVIELRDPGAGLDAFVVIDHDLFPVSAGGTRMLPDVDVREVARFARAMTWKFAACRVRYAGAKAGVRFAGGDRASGPSDAPQTRAALQAAPIAPKLGAETRYDGGPEEGSRGAFAPIAPPIDDIRSSPLTSAGERYDGGPEEVTRGAGR